MSIFKQGCQKMMKNWVSHILFLRKSGLIVYLATLKKGLFGMQIRTMSYIGSYPPEIINNG